MGGDFAVACLVQTDPCDEVFGFEVNLHRVGSIDPDHLDSNLFCHQLYWTAPPGMHCIIERPSGSHT